MPRRQRVWHRGRTPSHRCRAAYAAPLKKSLGGFGGATGVSPLQATFPVLAVCLFHPDLVRGPWDRPVVSCQDFVAEILANLQGRGKRVGDKPRILPRPNQCLTRQRFRAPFDIALELAFVEYSAQWNQPLDERSPPSMTTPVSIGKNASQRFPKGRNNLEMPSWSGHIASTGANCCDTGNSRREINSIRHAVRESVYRSPLTRHSFGLICVFRVICVICVVCDIRGSSVQRPRQQFAGRGQFAG
jgi:hypothetical protein